MVRRSSHHYCLCLPKLWFPQLYQFNLSAIKPFRSIRNNCSLLLQEGLPARRVEYYLDNNRCFGYYKNYLYLDNLIFSSPSNKVIGQEIPGQNRGDSSKKVKIIIRQIKIPQLHITIAKPGM